MANEKDYKFNNHKYGCGCSLTIKPLIDIQIWYDISYSKDDHSEETEEKRNKPFLASINGNILKGRFKDHCEAKEAVLICVKQYANKLLPILTKLISEVK